MAAMTLTKLLAIGVWGWGMSAAAGCGFTQGRARSWLALGPGGSWR